MKKIVLITLMSLISVLMAGMVYGECICTFDQTATTVGTSSTYIRGTAKNISITVTNCILNSTRWENASVGTLVVTGISANTSLYTNATANIEKGNCSYFNFTINTGEFRDDATSYTFTATIRNSTNGTAVGGGILATCTRDYIVDNTQPVATLVSPTSGSIDTDGTIGFSYTCTNSNLATLYLEAGAGYSRYSMAESSDVCTHTEELGTNGIHSFYIISSDGLNTTTSLTSNIEVRKPGGIIYDEQGQIMEGTAGAVVKTENKVSGTINGIFDFIFGIFDKIFSIFK